MTNGQSAAVASIAQWQSCVMCECMRSGLTWRPALGKSLQMNWNLNCLICCEVHVVTPVLMALWLSRVHVNPCCCSSSVIEWFSSMMIALKVFVFTSCRLLLQGSPEASEPCRHQGLAARAASPCAPGCETGSAGVEWWACKTTLARGKPPLLPAAVSASRSKESQGIT